MLAIALAPHFQKPIAIMIHGAGGGGWEYVLWQKEYQSAGYQVIARDLMPSKPGLVKTRYSDYVKQVESWVPRGRRPDVIIGASMGGILTLTVANKLKPKAIILINSALPKRLIKSQRVKKNPPVIKWANGPIEDTRSSMPDSDEAMIQFAWKRWRDESGAILDTIQKGVRVQKPKMRSLFVIGGKDDTIPPAKSRALAKWIGADIAAYKGMSHVGPLMSTRGAEVAQRTLAWLKSR